MAREIDNDAVALRYGAAGIEILHPDTILHKVREAVLCCVVTDEFTHLLDDFITCTGAKYFCEIHIYGKYG